MHQASDSGQEHDFQSESERKNVNGEESKDEVCDLKAVPPLDYDEINKVIGDSM